MHTDAAQMIGKGRVDVQELGVDYLTIVGHKVWPCSCDPAADHPVGHLCWGARGTLGAPKVVLWYLTVAKDLLLGGALQTDFTPVEPLWAGGAGD